jgi:hypothetical protein
MPLLHYLPSYISSFLFCFVFFSIWTAVNSALTIYSLPLPPSDSMEECTHSFKITFHYSGNSKNDYSWVFHAVATQGKTFCSVSLIPCLNFYILTCKRFRVPCSLIGICILSKPKSSVLLKFVLMLSCMKNKMSNSNRNGTYSNFIL